MFSTNRARCHVYCRKQIVRRLLITKGTWLDPWLFGIAIFFFPHVGRNQALSLYMQWGVFLWSSVVEESLWAKFLCQRKRRGNLVPYDMKCFTGINIFIDGVELRNLKLIVQQSENAFFRVQRNVFEAQCVYKNVGRATVSKWHGSHVENALICEGVATSTLTSAAELWQTKAFPFSLFQWLALISLWQTPHCNPGLKGFSAVRIDQAIFLSAPIRDNAPPYSGSHNVPNLD